MALTRKRKRKIKSAVIFTVVLLVVLIDLIPIVLILLNSLRTNAQVSSALFAIPTELHWENYAHVFVTGEYLYSYLLNLILGIGAVLLTEILVLLSAYGIVKMNAYGSNFFTGYFLVSMSVPVFGILIPLFFAYVRMGLNNTIIGLVLLFTAINIPFSYLLVRSYLIGVSKEMNEAAEIDGANTFQVLTKIILPLCMPIMATIALVVFTSTWNNFQIPNIFYSSAEHKLISMNFYRFIGKVSSDLAYIFTAAVLAMLPILILYFSSQKSFIEGMTQGSVKG